VRRGERARAGRRAVKVADVGARRRVGAQRARVDRWARRRVCILRG